MTARASKAWQVEFHVIPRRAIAAKGAIASLDLNDSSWWAAHTLPSDYQARLTAIAPETSSGEAQLRTWGAEDGNRIDVLLEGGRVRSVMVRVDVRRLDSTFGAALIQFVRRADAVLVRRDGLVVEPQIGAYAAALRSSNAWKFASDPAPFVSKYREEEDA